MHEVRTLPRGPVERPLDRQRTQRREALTGAFVCTGIFLVLTLLAATSRGWLTDLDRTLGRGPYRLGIQHQDLRDLAIGLEHLTAPDHLVWAGAAVAAYLAWRGRWRLAAFSVVSVWAARELYPVFKGWVERPRPAWADPVHTVGGWSFPSGHATVGGAAAWTVMVLAVVLAGDVVRRRRWLTAAGAAAVVVGMDRLLLGVHYFTDVLAGMALSGAVVLFTAAALDPFRERATVIVRA
jgi:membrane-associated phospholipid phosphatase